MTQRISQQQLESYLWGAATLLRGTIDAGDYKQFIFPLLFYKRLCDVFDEETQTALAESGGDQAFAAYPENHRFQIPPESHWRQVRETAKNVGQAIHAAMRAIETANPDKLYGIFGDAQWTNKDRLSDAMLRDLTEHFSSLELTIANLPEDELGNGYEYLIKKFADDSGHTAAEFYTNRTVVHLMTEMLQPQPGESIYDPTCGSGGMLLSCIAHLRRRKQEWRNVRLFGQERNLMTSSIARMNCFLHGIEDFRIERGDTLAEPKFVEGDQLMQFDLVLANPPYSIKQWDRATFTSDPWGRNLYGTPPASNADYAFFQHILCSLAPKTGRCAILFPHGILFRDIEAEMRRNVIAADLIECVVGLGPNLFYNSSMESCVVICRTAKPKSRRGRILFINAVNAVTRERAQSFLTDDHIDHIVAAYRACKEEVGFAHVATRDEIRSRDGNLNLQLYVDNVAATAGAVCVRQPSIPEALGRWIEIRPRLVESLGAISPKISVPKLNTRLVAADSWEILDDRSAWQRVRLGDVAEKTEEVERDPLAAGFERYLMVEHLDAESLRIRRWGLIADGNVPPTFNRVFRRGQILYPTRRPYLRRTAVADFDGICGEKTLRLTACAGVDPRFLPFVFQSEAFIAFATNQQIGSVNPHVRWRDVAEFEFSLPPSDRQRRIAEVLLAVDAVRAAYHEARAAAEDAVNAKLVDILGDDRGHTHYPTRPLKEIAHLQTGLAKGRKYSSDVATLELPYLRVANVQEGCLDLSEMKTIVVSETEKERYLLRDGDVVICEGGDADKVGRGTMWRGEVRDCLHQNHVFCLRADRSALLPEFLTLQLGSPYGKKYFLGCAKKTSNLASINSTQVKAFPFQLPDLPEQERVVHEVRLLQDVKKSLDAQLIAINSMLRLLLGAVV